MSDNGPKSKKTATKTAASKTSPLKTPVRTSRRVIETFYVDAGDNPTTTIRVPQQFLNTAKRLRAEIIRRGTGQISDELGVFTNTKCTLCTAEMQPTGALLVCACGMAKPKEVTAVANISNIFGYALTALGALLGPEKPSTKR
jgi:hypothetical protein